MKPSLAHRLVGFCAFSTLTIAAFSLKIVWWELSLPPTQRSQGIPMTVVLAIVAAATTVGSWKEKPWGYILAILLCARENIVAVQFYYSQPAGFNFRDIFAVALSGIPLAGGMIAAIVLLVDRYSKKEPNQPPEPTAPSGRGSS
jgi:hypothetical protein